MIASSKVDKSKVNGLVWKNEREFVTFGVKHFKHWELNGSNLK